MKKLVFAVAALGLISLTSCKKDYTCTCTVSGQTIKAAYVKVKKSDAQKSCDAAGVTYSSVGGKCTLD